MGIALLASLVLAFTKHANMSCWGCFSVTAKLLDNRGCGR
jgi:hypothetical protein